MCIATNITHMMTKCIIHSVHTPITFINNRPEINNKYTIKIQIRTNKQICTLVNSTILFNFA